MNPRNISPFSSSHTVVVRRPSGDFNHQHNFDGGSNCPSPDVSAPLLQAYRSTSGGHNTMPNSPNLASSSSTSSPMMMERSGSFSSLPHMSSPLLTSSTSSSPRLSQSPWLTKRSGNGAGGGLSLKPFTRRYYGRAYRTLAVLALSGIALYLVLKKSTNTSRGRAQLRLNHQGSHAYAIHDPELAPYETHPIKQLIQEAKLAWKAKNDRQSKTYKEAVDEYQRRYKRSPPKGFEVWYEWARANEIPLIDEYDIISQQIAPYLALRPSEVRRRVEELDDPEGAGRDHTILRLFRGHTKYTGSRWREPVGDSFQSLLEDISHLIPDVVAPLYQHDASFIQMDYEVKQAYIEAAEKGLWVDEDKLQLDDYVAGWTHRERTCAPESSFRRTAKGIENPVEPGGPSFIRDHAMAMEYCHNPSIELLHGAISHDTGLRKLIPSFAMSTLANDGDLVWPSTIQYDLNPENEKPFLEKTGHKVLWRGSPDGIFVADFLKWKQSHRFRLITMANSNDTAPRTLRVTAKDSFGKEYQKDVATNLAELNARYSDIRVTGGPVQCEPQLCKLIASQMTFSPHASLEDMAEDRYVMDVDGNAYSARFRAHLHSNQVPLKSTIYKEWYYDRIQPWVHYVPVRIDYSDVYNILSFFDGGLDAARTGHHDDLAEEIASAGREWAETHWRHVDMQAYVFRLLLEWHRVLDPSRDP